jgi:hypothetical protein
MTRAQADIVIKVIKSNANSLIARMRENINESTRFEWEDLSIIWFGFRRR